MTSDADQSERANATNDAPTRGLGERVRERADVAKIIEVTASLIAITAFGLSIFEAVGVSDNVGETRLARAFADAIQFHVIFKILFFLILDTCLSFFFINFLRGLSNRRLKPRGGAAWIFGNLLNVIFIFINAWTTIFAIEILFLNGEPLAQALIRFSDQFNRDGEAAFTSALGLKIAYATITTLISIVIVVAFAMVERNARLAERIKTTALRYAQTLVSVLVVFLPIYLFVFVLAAGVEVSPNDVIDAFERATGAQRFSPSD